MTDETKRPQEQDSKSPIGDPPSQAPPMKADQPMQDPFTEQATQPAGEGQGANRPQPGQASSDDEEETLPVEEGFSPVP